MNNAYAKKDLEKVKEILHSLESGKSFDVASDTITDIELLRSKIIDIRNSMVIVGEEIEIIKSDEVTSILEENDDLDIYFENLQEQLEQQYENLKNQKKELERSYIAKMSTNEEKEYWNELF